MKIAQVAPLFESVPPRLYGGSERVVSYLTEELVRLGHDVTLFASADSLTGAKLRPMCDQALRLDDMPRDHVVHHLLMVNQVFNEAHSFDIIHFHLDCLHFPLARRSTTPHVTTLHGRLDLHDLRFLFDEFADLPVVSISDAQRGPLPRINWQATVYNGIAGDELHFQPHPADYLAFLGRVSPEKGLEAAIEIALALGMKLRIAAKVDPVDERYFNEVVRPLLEKPRIEFIGEINEREKNDFLGQARALLFPINWPEPFGLVMIEAMACGTPIVAFGHGSVPEIIEHGVSGFVVENVAEAIAAVRNIDAIDRANCRRAFMARFSARKMAEGYLKVYRNLVATRRKNAIHANGESKDGRRHTDKRQVVYSRDLANRK
jgi:glycosyltransferase involved in cell wall biosynthesis